MTTTNDAVVSFEDEPLIVVDADDAVIGYETKSTVHDGTGIRHRAFSILLFDGQGRMLLQQRSAAKRLWPMIWSNACCSHPRRGEEIPAAAHRRLQEELGVSVPLQELFKFEYRAEWADEGVEHEICTVFIGRLDEPIVANPNEIHAVRHVLARDLQAIMDADPEAYSPWLRLEWHRVRNDHWAQVEALWR